MMGPCRVECACARHVCNDCITGQVGPRDGTGSMDPLLLSAPWQTVSRGAAVPCLCCLLGVRFPGLRIAWPPFSSFACFVAQGLVVCVSQEPSARADSVTTQSGGTLASVHRSTFTNWQCADFARPSSAHCGCCLPGMLWPVIQQMLAAMFQQRTSSSATQVVGAMVDHGATRQDGQS
jgi:hypothetical protein